MMREVSAMLRRASFIFRMRATVSQVCFGVSSSSSFSVHVLCMNTGAPVVSPQTTAES